MGVLRFGLCVSFAFLVFSRAGVEMLLGFGRRVILCRFAVVNVKFSSELAGWDTSKRWQQSLRLLLLREKVFASGKACAILMVEVGILVVF